MSLIKDMLTSGSGVSSKRAYGGLALLVFLAMGFILQWRATVIANQALFSSWMDYLFLFIIASLLGVVFETAAKMLGKKGVLEGQASVTKAANGTGDVINENVETQTVSTGKE